MITSRAARLGPSEAAVLAWADREEHVRITTAEIAAIVGARGARAVAASLANKGLLARLSKGIYRVLSMGALGRPRVGSPLAGAALLMGDRPYYVGGRSAASYHRLTSQRYSGVVDVYSPRPLHHRDLWNARLMFHPATPQAMQFGVSQATLDGVEVLLSDPERTVLDLLDRPDRLLGFQETCAILSAALPRLDAVRLVAYASRWPKMSTVRRIGVLLEREGVTDTTLAPLVERVATSRGDAVLAPGGGRRGPMHPRFRVVLNDTEQA